MLHTFTKKGLRGFTLIELLVVIAIIGLLSTVIAAPITEARKKGRDSKKISDIRSMVTALSLYADDNAGAYPPSLDGLVPRYLPNLPSQAATSTIGRDKYLYTTYTDSGPGRIVAYHLGTKLESGNQALNDDADCGGVETAGTGALKPCISSAAVAGSALQICSSASSCTARTSNAATGDAGTPVGTASSDFGSAADTGTTTCTSALTTCIYDIVN